MRIEYEASEVILKPPRRGNVCSVNSIKPYKLMTRDKDVFNKAMAGDKAAIASLSRKFNVPASVIKSRLEATKLVHDAIVKAKDAKN